MGKTRRNFYAAPVAQALLTILSSRNKIGKHFAEMGKLAKEIENSIF
jgi:hypothetical protein